MNLDYRQLIASLFALIISILLVLIYSCSAQYHIEKAVKKGAKIESRIDTVRIYSKDSLIIDGKKEYFYTYRDTIRLSNTVYMPKTRYQTKTEYKIIKEQIKEDAKSDRLAIKEDAKTDRKELQVEKKTSINNFLKFILVIGGLILLIVVLLKTNKRIGL
jgi:hypothetical protein